MKTNKLPESAWTDSRAAGSQSQQPIQSNSYNNGRHAQQKKNASNDADYSHKKLSNENLNGEYSHHLADDMSSQDSYFGYKSADKSLTKAKESAMINSKTNQHLKNSDSDKEQFNIANG